MGFLSFLSGKKETPEQEQQKTAQKNFEIFKYDGMRAQRMGRIDYAIKCFTEAIALQPDFETSGYLAQAYTQTGMLTEARTLLERMTKEEPTHSPSLTSLAQIELAQDDGLMALAHLTQAIMHQADYIPARLLRAQLLLDMKQISEAQEDITNVLSQEPENETALFLRAHMYTAQGDSAAAEADYRQLISLDPFFETAYKELGALLTAEHRLDEATALLAEAREMIPGFGEDITGDFSNRQPEAPAPRQTDVLGL